MICAVERLPRSLSIGEFSRRQPSAEGDSGDDVIEFEFHPERFDEAFWEASETIGYECRNERCPLLLRKFSDLEDLLTLADGQHPTLVATTSA